MVKTIVPHFIWLFLLFIAYDYFNQVNNGGNGYKTGDWLINYSEGPIRRGLIGTLFYYSAGLGMSLRWITYVVQVLFYVAVFFFVSQIYSLREREWEWTLFLFSPAFLLFPFYDLAGGFRKEIIVFASFGLLCFCYARRQVRNIQLLAVGAIFLLAAFSHEPTALTLPFFLYIFYQCYKHALITKSVALVTSLSFCFISIFAVLFAYVFKGDSAIASAICKSVMEKGFESQICRGAIAWLAKDAAYNTGLVYNVLWGSLKLYVPLLLISITPIFLVSWLRRETVVLLLIGMLFRIPLLIVATDWGRWIHIYVFFLFSIVLAESVWKKLEFRKIPLFVVFLYLTTWSVPHDFCGSDCNGFNGFISKAYKLLNMVSARVY